MRSAHDLSDMRGVIAADGTAKARIERAAIELFVERTIEGTSTKAIATLAGVSEGLTYRHFRSKDDLARSLMLAIHNRLTDMIQAQIGAPIDIAVTHIVKDYTALADKDWALFRYHILHIHSFENLAKSSPLEATAKLIRAAQKRGEIPGTQRDAPRLAGAALGVVLGVAQSKMLGGVTGRLSRHNEVLSRAVIAVLKAG